MVSIVAKTTKFEKKMSYFKSIVSHIKNPIVSHINLRKMTLKFHYA